MQATGRLATAAAGVLMCLGVALLLQGSGRGGVELEGTGKDASPKNAVNLLASLYSEPCHVPTPPPLPPDTTLRTLKPQPWTLNPEPSTPNSKPPAPPPNPQTLTLEPHTQCSPGIACKCVTDSAAKVAAALDNAVAREFGPPNMYHPSKRENLY